MNNRLYTLLAAAALVAAGACSGGGGDDAAAPDGQQPAGNVASGNATAADVQAVMKARHEHYREMGRAMKGIGDQLKGGSPDVAAIQRHSATIAGFGPQILSWFPEGSGADAGRTRAKAEVWSDAAAFRAATERFQQASTAFDAAARSGDADAMRTALPDLQASCKNCHDRFRGPELD